MIKNNLCKAIINCSRWIQKNLTKSYRLGIPLHEETITQIMLLNLAKIGQLKIKAYSKAEENLNGADWSFWICENNSHEKGVELRMQAKRLYPSGRYEALNINGNQRNILIDISRNENTIPIYIFYNDESIEKYISEIEYCSQSCELKETWGCTYLPVNKITSAVPSHPAPVDITNMRPLHKLFCSCDSHLNFTKKSQLNLPQIVINNLTKNGMSEIEIKCKPDWVTLVDEYYEISNASILFKDIEFRFNRMEENITDIMFLKQEMDFEFDKLKDAIEKYLKINKQTRNEEILARIKFAEQEIKNIVTIKDISEHDLNYLYFSKVFGILKISRLKNCLRALHKSNIDKN